MSDSQSLEELLNISQTQLQSWQLILRNKVFKNEVSRIRNKYGVGMYSFDSDSPTTLYDLLDELKNTDFEDDISKLSDKITASGDWADVIKYYTLGFDPDMLAYNVKANKSIEIKENDGLVQVKIKGDFTVPELRSHINDIRNAVVRQNHAGYSPKFKPKLQKNLIIYDLHNKGMKHRDIADFCDKENLQKNIGYEDISKYVELTEKQIEKIVA